MSQLSEKTVDKAIDVLDGIREITKNEMLVARQYVSQDIVDPELAAEGAICGGRNACLVGSAYLAAGIKLKKDDMGFVDLPGIGDADDRARFRKNRPGLRVAMDALNEAALARIEKLPEDEQNYVLYEGIVSIENEGDAAECLFENTPIHANREDILKLVTEAKRIIRRKARA